jgi:hypothetical protein
MGIYVLSQCPKTVFISRLLSLRFGLGNNQNMSVQLLLKINLKVLEESANY